MIVKATHNTFLYGFFRLYTKVRINRSFQKVEIEGKLTDRGMPVLVIANHFSWWDGFWVMYMNMKLFRRKFFFMMLEEQLRKHMFFNKTGGYPVRRGSRSIIESIQFTKDLLKDKGNMVLMFPQGKIFSNYTGTIIFEKGVERILAEAAGRVQVIFEVNLVEYLSHSRPSLYIYLCEYSGPGTRADLEAAYNKFYASALKTNAEKTGS